MKKFQRAAPVQAQLADLRRKVNRNTAETGHFLDTHVFAPASGALLSYPTNLTADFIGSSTFRDNITGDKWRNKTLHLNILAQPNVGTSPQFRFVIYKPKKAGTSWTPGGGLQPMVAFPDPSAFTLLYDKTWMPNRDGNQPAWKKTIKLESMTLYNQDSATIEKGELKMLVLAFGAAGTSFQVATDLVYQNK